MKDFPIDFLPNHLLMMGFLDMTICTESWFADLVAKHRDFREKDQQYIWGIYDAKSGNHVGMVNLFCAS